MRSDLIMARHAIWRTCSYYRRIDAVEPAAVLEMAGIEALTQEKT
jgi:hypothetical protein